MSKNFIDELEHELRAATRRRARLALARVPRAPAGIATVVLTLAICAAVAVPFLQARTRPPGGGGAPGGTGSHASSVVRTCADTVSGQLPHDWHTPRHGTVLAGPITWPFLLRNGLMPHHGTHLIQGLAVVTPGRGVTVSIPAYERHRLSLDYTNVDPSVQHHGVSSVTFKPCPGPAGQTQFNGGFIVKGPQCAAVFIQPVGDAGIIERFLPFGRSCWAENHPPTVLGVEMVLEGDRVGPARFGETPKRVGHHIDYLLGPASKPYHGIGACQIDHAIQWPGLTAYFQRGHFAGYAYAGHKGRGSVLATVNGLLVGDTLKAAARLYGSKFHVTPAQGGAWSVRTAQGRIEGFTSLVTNPNGKVLTIEAGDVGCPAMTP